MKKFICIVILVAIAYFGYKHLNSENVGAEDTIGQKIPESVFNTSPDDKYLEYFTGDKKVIYFAYATCNIGRKMRTDTREALFLYSNGELSESYVDRSELIPQGSTTFVPGNHSAHMYLMNKCSGGYVCIINPRTKRMLQLNPRLDTYKEELLKYKDW